MYKHVDKERNNDIIILLVGQTGHGKSATGNSILGWEAFKSKLSPKSVTDRIQRQIGVRNGRRIEIVDTPGLADTSEDKDIEKLLTEALFQTLPGLNAVLFVLKPDRFTNELVKTVTSIFNFFGHSVSKFAFVLFTYTKTGEKMNEYLEGIGDEASGNLLTLKDLLDKCENKKLFIDNENEAEQKNIMVNDIICSIDKNVQRLGQHYFTNDMYKLLHVFVDRCVQPTAKTNILQKISNVKIGHESHNMVGRRKQNESSFEIVRKGKNLQQRSDQPHHCEQLNDNKAKDTHGGKHDFRTLRLRMDRGVKELTALFESKQKSSKDKCNHDRVYEYTSGNNVSLEFECRGKRQYKDNKLGAFSPSECANTAVRDCPKPIDKTHNESGIHTPNTNSAEEVKQFYKQQPQDTKLSIYFPGKSTYKSDDTTSNDGSRCKSNGDKSSSKAEREFKHCNRQQRAEENESSNYFARKCTLTTDEADYTTSTKDLRFNQMYDLTQTITEQGLEEISEDDQIDEHSLAINDDMLLTRRSSSNINITSDECRSNIGDIKPYFGSVPFRKYDSFKRNIDKKPGFFNRVYVAFGKWFKRFFITKNY